MADFHKHHIVYRSQGGSDEISNLSILSPYDHALLHALDFLEGGPSFDFRHEAWPLLPEEIKVKVTGEKSRRLTENKLMDYPGVRESVSNKLKGKRNPRFGKPAVNKGVPHSKSTKEKISATKIGVPNPGQSVRMTLNNPMKKQEVKEKCILNLQRTTEELRQQNLGRKWWVNQKGESRFTFECPGPEWQAARKWRN
jgi:hypothetical protein